MYDHKIGGNGTHGCSWIATCVTPRRSKSRVMPSRSRAAVMASFNCDASKELSETKSRSKKNPWLVLSSSTFASGGSCRRTKVYAGSGVHSRRFGGSTNRLRVASIEPDRT